MTELEEFKRELQQYIQQSRRLTDLEERSTIKEAPKKKKEDKESLWSLWISSNNNTSISGTQKKRGEEIESLF